MRFEQQDWDNIIATFEVVIGGVFTTGLAPTVAIRRRSDGLWLQVGGLTWGAGKVALTMVEPDAVNRPGWYQYDVPLGGLSKTAGALGYEAQFVETTRSLGEWATILPRITAGDPLDELMSSHTVADSVGDYIARTLRLRQHNTLVVYTAWNSQRVPTAGIVYVYATRALLLTDVAGTPGANAVGSYAITAVFNGSLQPTMYYSTKET